MEPRHHFLRNADAGALAEVFLVTAGVTIVFTRVLLGLLGWPSIGGSRFHIAHMLWGGLLLTFALLLVLFVLNRRTKYVAAFIGGVGFGLFIDELGKFITRDHDYFFQPTYALIYVVFVLLYFSIRKLILARPLSPTEHTANSLELLKEIVANDFSPQEKERALSHLEHAQRERKDVRGLRQYVVSAKLGKPERSYYAIVKGYLLRKYNAVVRKEWFRRTIAFLFIAQAALYTLSIVRFIYENRITGFGQLRFFDWGLLLSYGVAVTFIIIGLFFYLYSYLHGLRWFERATITAVFLVGFFSFYHNQLVALLGILYNVVMLSALSVIISIRTNRTVSREALS